MEFVDAETVMAVLVTKPLMDSSGLEAIGSENVAVKVTLVASLTKLFSSLSVKLSRVGLELSMVKVILSVPAYALPDKSVPDTVAVVIETVDPETVHEYVQVESDAVALINALEIIPVNDSVGVAVMLSEKVAVIVTTSELETRLSESVSVMLTVGVVLSIVKVILSVPE